MLRTTIAVALSFGIFGCISHKSPGTKPADMSAKDHAAECAKHERLALAQDKRAEELDGGKGTYTAQYTADHERNVAKQHGDAAKVVDPNAPDCAQ